MASLRRLAILAGAAFLITHVTSVAAVILYTPILNDPNYIISSSSDNSVLLGAFLEIILAFAVVATSVTLYPVVKKQNQAIALGYVGLRTLEAGIIGTGVITFLTIVKLHQQLGQQATMGINPSLITLGQGLVAFHNWTFLLGPGFTSGTNTVLISYLMYKSKLVPRPIPTIGLVGGPLVFASATSVLFGLIGQYSTIPALVAIPEFAWEVSLAAYLIVKGFKLSSGIMHQ